MGARKKQKQSRTVHEWTERGGFECEADSISIEEIPLTSKYQRIDDISELEPESIYYWRGLNGRLGHSCCFNPDAENCLDYIKILKKQIDRGIIFVLKKPKKKVKRNEVVGVESMF